MNSKNYKPTGQDYTQCGSSETGCSSFEYESSRSERMILGRSVVVNLPLDPEIKL